VKQRFARRPPRLSRVFQTNPLYFVTLCTHRRLHWLACDEIHIAFIRFAQRAESKFNVAVGRYVLMPDHIHLFVRGGLDFVLGHWIGMLKQVLAKAGHRSGQTAQNWQESCFDHVLRHDESYAEKWNYVRENPVRAGLVNSWEDWPYQGEIVYIDRA
jgi:putative transposase